MANGDKISYGAISLWAAVITVLAIVIGGLVASAVKQEHRSTITEGKVERVEENQIPQAEKTQFTVQQELVKARVSNNEEDIKALQKNH